MINLSSIVQSAQGGQAIDNIAQRFGLSPEQAQSAINALLPAVQMGLQNASQNGTAGSILSHLGDPAHQHTYDTPTAPAPENTAQGGSILGSLFSGHSAATGVAQQASTESGVSPSIIQAMMPMVISVVMGGIARGAQGGSFGGSLSGILGSVLGGSGSMFGQGATVPQTAPSSSEGGGGFGGLIGSVLGGLLGGGGGQAPSADQSAPPAGTASGGTPESVLDEISSMVTAGTPSSPDHENRLASILGR